MLPDSDTSNYWKHAQLRVSEGSEFGAGWILEEQQHGEGNQSGAAEGATACGGSSSSVVTKRNRNQMEEIKCLCQTGGTAGADSWLQSVSFPLLG